jgi:hypothetical protein
VGFRLAEFSETLLPIVASFNNGQAPSLDLGSHFDFEHGIMSRQATNHRAKKEDAVDTGWDFDE